MNHRSLLDWIGRHLWPVDERFFAAEGPLAALVGDAQLVSLGEGLHGAAEPLEFRNRLFRWLVEERRFAAIALESGMTSAFDADDFVQGGPGDAAGVAARSITSGLGRFPQQAALLAWMRDHNARAGAGHAVGFHGMDTSAFAPEPGSALQRALDFLDAVDAPAAAALRERLRPHWDQLRIDRQTAAPAHYALLAPAARDAVTAAIADLVLRLETHEEAYLARRPAPECRRAWLAAVGARQSDLYLRQFPPGWSAAAGVASHMPSIAASDRGKADNVDLLLASLGPAGRMLVFSHLGHAASSPVSITVGTECLALPPLMGSYLRRRHGPRLLTIGHLFAADRCHAGRAPAGPDTLEGAFASLGVPAFVVDLRRAPAPVLESLRTPHDLYGTLPVHTLTLAGGVDALLFTQAATPA